MTTINTAPWQVPNTTGYSSKMSEVEINKINDKYPGFIIRIISDGNMLTGYIGTMKSVMTDGELLLRGDGELMGSGNITQDSLIDFMKLQFKFFFGYESPSVVTYTVEDWNDKVKQFF